MLDVTIKHNAKAKSNAASNIFFLVLTLHFSIANHFRTTNIIKDGNGTSIRVQT